MLRLPELAPGCSTWPALTSQCAPVFPTREYPWSSSPSPGSQHAEGPQAVWAEPVSPRLLEREASGLGVLPPEAAGRGRIESPLQPSPGPWRLPSPLEVPDQGPRRVQVQSEVPTKGLRQERHAGRPRHPALSGSAVPLDPEPCCVLLALKHKSR